MIDVKKSQCGPVVLPSDTCNRIRQFTYLPHITRGGDRRGRCTVTTRLFHQTYTKPETGWQKKYFENCSTIKHCIDSLPITVLEFVIEMQISLATLTLNALKKKIFTYLKLCLATATHNFKWVKITHICQYIETKHLQILLFKHTFRFKYQWFNRFIKQIKNDYSRP